ncbi:hypothetical protein D3C73_665170 [compost metagenome]
MRGVDGAAFLVDDRENRAVHRGADPRITDIRLRRLDGNLGLCDLRIERLYLCRDDLHFGFGGLQIGAGARLFLVDRLLASEGEVGVFQLCDALVALRLNIGKCRIGGFQRVVLRSGINERDEIARLHRVADGNLQRGNATRCLRTDGDKP